MDPDGDILRDTESGNRKKWAQLTLKRGNKESEEKEIWELGKGEPQYM